MSNSLKQDIRNLAILVLLAGVIFGFRLGSFGLLDPDEPFYSLTAKEMLNRHDWSTPVLFGQPQFEKPILFYWIICLAFKIFGISESAARIGPLLAGMATVLVTYLWGITLFKRRTIALLSAVILATAAEFMVVSRIVLTDVFLCLFVTLAFFSFSFGYERPKSRQIAWFFIFIFCALGFLTKGPLAVILPWASIFLFLIINQEEYLLKSIPWMSGVAAFALIAAPWYALMAHRYGPDFLKHFFIHENVRRFFVAEHKNSDKIFFYPATIFIGFFPWSAFLLGAVFYSFRRALGERVVRYRSTFLFLSISFVSVFIFFTLAKSKLMSYILPVFPLMALMMGGWLFRVYRALQNGVRPKVSLKILSVLFFGILPTALIIGCLIYGKIARLDILKPILAIAVFMPTLSWAFLFNVHKKKYRAAFYCVIAEIVISACLIFGWLLPRCETEFSSRQDVILLEKTKLPSSSPLILADRLFVRGISYYSGSNNVSVLTDDPESAFYTKHPILMFSTADDLLKIDKNSFPVYCFLKPKGLRLLEKIADKRFSISTLHSGSNKVFLRLDRTDAFLPR